MKAFFNTFKSDKILLLGIAGAFLCLLLGALYIAFSYSLLPPLLPLFNQMPWGYQRLGTKEQLFMPITLSSFILIGNSIAAFYVYKPSPLIGRLLSITSLLVCFFALLFTIRTIRLVL